VRRAALEQLRKKGTHVWECSEVYLESRDADERERESATKGWQKEKGEKE